MLKRIIEGDRFYETLGQRQRVRVWEVGEGVGTVYKQL